MRLVASQARQVASSRGLTLHYWSLADGLTCCLLGWYGRSSWSVIASQLETLSVKRALSLLIETLRGGRRSARDWHSLMSGIVGGEPRGGAVTTLASVSLSMSCPFLLSFQGNWHNCLNSPKGQNCQKFWSFFVSIIWFSQRDQYYSTIIHESQC